MKQKRSNNNIRKKDKKNINFIHFLGIIFCSYFVYTMYVQQIQINNYDSQIEMYKSDIKAKNDLVEYFSNQKQNIQSDEYIENVAREKLGYVKPYEKIFIDANR